MATTDDTLKARLRLEKTIEAQRKQLLQAHGVLTCLYEVLLHAEDEEAVSYAQAAYVAANLINKSVEDVHAVRLYPMLDVLAPPLNRVEEPASFVPHLRERCALPLPARAQRADDRRNLSECRDRQLSV